MHKFYLYLQQLNRLCPSNMQKTESEIAVKILSCFDPTSSVGIIAMVEHTAKLDKREFWRPAVDAVAADPDANPPVRAVAAKAATRDLIPLMQQFDSLWRKVFQATQDGTKGQQADGAFHADDDQAFYVNGKGGDSRSRRGGRGARGGSGFSAARAGRASDAITKRANSHGLTYEQCIQEKIVNCFGCGGYGHLLRDCENPAGVKVPPAIALRLLQDGQKRAGVAPDPRPPRDAREGRTHDRAFAINDGNDYNAYDACEECDDPESRSESLYCDEKEDAAYFAAAEIQDLEDIFAADVGGSGYDAPPDILLCDEPTARHLH